MSTAKEHYIVDADGNRSGVVLDIAEYRRMLEELEELEELRAYDAAKAAGEDVLPFEEALTEIVQDRTRGNAGQVGAL